KKDWEPLGEVKSLNHLKNKVSFALSKGEMIISYIQPDIVQIQASRRLSSIPSSWAIEKELESFENIRVKENKEKFVISPLSTEEQGLSIAIDKQTSCLKFKNLSGIILNSESSPCSTSEGWYMVEREAGDESEHYYGLGENTGSLDKRGQIVSFWNTDSIPYNNKDTNLYQSQPVQVVVRENGFCYAVVYDNPHKAQIKIKRKGEKYFTSYYVAGGGIKYYVLLGKSIPDLFSKLTYLLGKAPLPPIAALGHHQSRWSYMNEEEVRTLAKTFREKNIPCDFIHLDIDYMDGYRVFTWNKERFPDPKRLIDDLAEIGFKLVAITDPGVKVDENYFMYKEGLEQGHFVKNDDGSIYQGEVWPRECHFPDFTQTSTRSWFGKHFQALTDVGIKGFWIDMNEPSIFSAIGTIPDNVIHTHNNESKLHSEIHNQYGHLMAKATYEGVKSLLPDERVFVLTRSAYLGTHRYAGSWTGDNNAEWKHLRLSLPMLMNMAISGQVMIGPDIGGFLGKPSSELLIRWYQAGVFYPFYRNHSINKFCSHEPWIFGGKTEQIIRESIKLRYKLLIYIYTAIVRACKTGIPAFRAMFIDYPTDSMVYKEPWASTQYLFGDYLLVAPVMRRWKRKRRIYLPKGEWYSLDGTKFRGGKEYTIKVSLNNTPIFVKSGSIIPVIETEIQSTEELLDKPLTLIIFGEENAEGQIYLDDGKTMNYIDGDYESIKLNARLECDKRG
ncbi:MAG: TIM-barrel domain-containing protein, partial [Candidatus Heimdallarchaeaceae archaeon]